MTPTATTIENYRDVRPLITNARALSLESKSLTPDLFNEVRSKTEATLFYVVNRVVREELFKHDWFFLALDVSSVIDRVDEAAKRGCLGSLFGATLMSTPGMFLKPEQHMPLAPRLYVGYHSRQESNLDYSNWPSVRKNVEFHYVELNL